jgi:hypothetical protein
MTKYMEPIFPGETRDPVSRRDETSNRIDNLEKDMSEVRRSLTLCLAGLNGLCNIVDMQSERMDAIELQGRKK